MMHERLGRRVLGYRQRQVYEYVNATIRLDGCAPSYEMIRAKLGITSRGKVCEIVERLEKRGLLRRSGRGRVRRIRLK